MATTGHENESINIGGLKSSLQALKTKFIDDLDSRTDTIEEALDTGGSVDTRIANAKSEIIGGATSDGNTLKKLEDRVSPLETAIGSGGSIDTRITNAINALDSSASQTAGNDGLSLNITETDGKITSIGGAIAANTYAPASDSTRITTLENNVGSGSVDTRISNAVSAERTRALAAESNLQDQYNALTQSDIIVGTLPASGTKNKIYRVPGTSSYSDYMWNGSSWVLMATYNNAVDNSPVEGSQNLITSGAVFDVDAKIQRAWSHSQTTVLNQNYKNICNVDIDAGVQSMAVMYMPSNTTTQNMVNLAVTYDDDSTGTLTPYFGDANGNWGEFYFTADGHIKNVYLYRGKAGVLAENTVTLWVICGIMSTFRGTCRPDSVPPTVVNNPYFQIAETPGTYLNYGNIVVENGESALITYNGHSFNKVVIGLCKNDLINVDFSNAIYGYIGWSRGDYNRDQNFNCIAVDVLKGDYITFVARGYSNSIAMIAKKHLPEFYVGLVPSEDATVRTYTYTATEDCTIILSYNKSYEHSCTIKRMHSLSGIEGKIVEAAHKSYLDVNLNADALFMFDKIGTIGDSFAAGTITDTSVSPAAGIGNERAGWPACLCKFANAEPAIYAQGGMRTKTWINDAGGKRTMFNNDTRCDAYFIALGVNDRNADVEDEPLGTINDATGTNSFVGYYNQIIELIHQKNPYAPIFCVSLYTKQDIAPTYSQMVSDIADLYDYCFYIDLIGEMPLDAKKETIYSSSSHYASLGYMYAAATIRYLVNKSVLENMNFYKYYTGYNYGQQE